MPPMQAGAPPAGQPAKTMFGYAAPQIPQAQQPQQPPQGQGRPSQPGAPGQPGYPQQGFAPPQQQGFAPPQQQGFAPPQQQGYPQPGQPHAYGQPPQQQGYPQPGQPQANPYGQPQQPQQGYPQPGQPQANPYGQPQQAQQPNPYGQQPQQPNPYGQPQQPQANPYGQPQAQQPQAHPYGQPQAQQPQANPYGQPHAQQPQPQAYGQPQAAAQPSYPAAQQGFGQPPPEHAAGMPGALSKLPGSPPGTIMGIPVARLRDPTLQRKAMFFAGIALIASIVVPLTLTPLQFAWSGGGFNGFLWPIISGGAYLLVTAAPQNLRDKVPPVVLQWIPFAVSYTGVYLIGEALAFHYPVSGLYPLAYATLCFGLLARIAKPEDQIARIIIGVGAVLMILSLLSALSFAFSFGGETMLPGLGKIVMIIYQLVWFVIIVLGSACILFVVPPQKLPPALRAVDAFGPMIAAALLAWLVIGPILLFLAMVLSAPAHILDFVLIFAHILLPVLAYFGILMMTAPGAYEEAKRMFAKNKAGGSPPPGQYPPQH